MPRNPDYCSDDEESRTSSQEDLARDQTAHCTYTDDDGDAPPVKHRTESHNAAARRTYLLDDLKVFGFPENAQPGTLTREELLSRHPHVHNAANADKYDYPVVAAIDFECANEPGAHPWRWEASKSLRKLDEKPLDRVAQFGTAFPTEVGVAMLDFFDIVREKFGKTRNQHPRPGGGRPGLFGSEFLTHVQGKHCIVDEHKHIFAPAGWSKKHSARDKAQKYPAWGNNKKNSWRLDILPEAFAYDDTEIAPAKHFASKIKSYLDTALLHYVQGPGDVVDGALRRRKVILLCHAADMEYKILEHFDLLNYLIKCDVTIVDIQKWPIWRDHVALCWGPNYTNPGAAMVLKSLAVRAEWTHPQTKQVYDFTHNSGNDAYHTIVAYLRTVFMPSDIAQAFAAGAPVPEEYALVPKVKAVRLERNIAHYGEDLKAPQNKQNGAAAGPSALKRKLADDSAGRSAPSKQARGGGGGGGGRLQ